MRRSGFQLVKCSSSRQHITAWPGATESSTRDLHFPKGGLEERLCPGVGGGPEPTQRNSCRDGRGS